MNHKVILTQVQESLVSFVGVSVNFEIRSAPCFAPPLVVITLEVFSCLGLEELGHQKKFLEKALSPGIISSFRERRSAICMY